MLQGHPLPRRKNAGLGGPVRCWCSPWSIWSQAWRASSGSKTFSEARFKPGYHPQSAGFFALEAASVRGRAAETLSMTVTFVSPEALARSRAQLSDALLAYRLLRASDAGDYQALAGAAGAVCGRERVAGARARPLRGGCSAAVAPVLGPDAEKPPAVVTGAAEWRGKYPRVKSRRTRVRSP